MPEPYERSYRHPGQKYRLKDAANNNQLIIARCRMCFRSRAYLASDLMEILDPDQDARTPPFVCGQCGTDDHIKVRLLSPALGDYGSIEVRRPAGVKQTQLWRTEKLGDTP